jgi:DNA polymerase I
MPKKLFLVDGSNYAFRVQFALPPRHTSAGFPTRVLYGFTLLFQKLMRTYRPDYCVVSFDIGKTFRHQVYPEYKANRDAMPEDLRQQWGELPDLVRAFGYPCINVENFEADDVLGTLAHRFSSDEVHAYLVTGDKDFGQLVNANVSVLDERKDVLLDSAGVESKMGVPPVQVIDLLGLAGDTSDNIPGVPGVGAKTAAKLLQSFGSLEGAIDAAVRGEVKGKRGENLVKFAADARLSKELATIRIDVPISEKLGDLAPIGIQAEPLREMFERWEFGMVARKLLPEQHTVDASVYRGIVKDEDLDEVLEEVAAAGRCAVSISSAGDDPFKALVTGISLAWAADKAVYIPLEPRFGVRLDLTATRQKIAAFMANPELGKVFRDAKAACHVLRQNDYEVQGVIGDTRLIDYVLVPHRRRHGLEDMAQRYLGHNLSIRSGQGELLIDDAVKHAVEPAHVVWLLFERLSKQLVDGLGFIYEQVELPIVEVLGSMERAGIRLDRERLAEIRLDIQARLDAMEKRCHELAGRPFKVGSTKEVAVVLFDELGLPPSKKTKTGFSTDSSVLEKLVEQHPIAGAILEYRMLAKLVSTYLKKLPGYVAEDGRIHTSFNQAVAATGRLSSTDPNLQNIPIRTFEGRRIRECFVPKEGHLFLSADYSQVELRVLAHYSNSRTLEEAFKAGEDIHARTASEVFGVPVTEVSIELRSAAKAINFGLLYGMSAFRLGNDLSISRAQAQQYMDDYFGRMPEVEGWLESTKAFCRENGYVETLYGRRRLIPEIYSKSFSERSAGEREAVNTCVQGTAADIIKIAMRKVFHRLKDAGYGAQILLQVHDELLLEVPEDEIEAVRELVVREMEQAVTLRVPLVVNSSVGANWNDAHG